jgi:hypothetical protein
MVQGLGTPFHDKVLTLLEPMLHIGMDICMYVV